MTKRPAGSDDGLRPKRPKTTTSPTNPATETGPDRHPVLSSRDLHLLLAFDQDLGPVPRQKIQSFNSFLASIAYAAQGEETSLVKRKILHDYLQSQVHPEGKESSTFLGEIIKTWHFAGQANTDSLFASVTAVLALFLKTISSFIDFREYGNRLCTILLHDDQIKLFDKALGSHRAKDHLILPFLQLLTEIVVFDGGHAASRLYRQREITFKRLDAFLKMRKDIKGDSINPSKRRSVRENALGYLFANLRLQSAAAKTNIIAQRNFLRALLDDIARDSSSVIMEILEVLRRDIALDGAISPHAKGRFFNPWTLSRLATLCYYSESANQDIKGCVHELLLLLCTSPACGVVEMRPASRFGIHPFMADKTLESLSQPDITNKLDHTTWQAGGNRRLQQFLQSLRPYASAAQCDLILAVFRSMPELVSDYFSSSNTFPFDPKLTTTWIGYSSFLLAAIAIPLPESLTMLSVNDAILPWYGTIMETVIPRSCAQKTMTRCLNQSVNLVKFFTLQILNTAFEKFAKVLQIFENLQHDTGDQKKRSAWYDVVSKLRHDFCLRVPEMRHIISLFRSCPKENMMLRESTTRLIALYYKLIPHVALEEKLDISVSLSTALVDSESFNTSHEQSGLRLLEIEHLLQIAHRSPNMKWWHKPESTLLSPFTMLLRFLNDQIRAKRKTQELGLLLMTVAKESHILRSYTSTAARNNLVLSLRDSEDWKATDRVFEFIDHCISHLVRKPIHYYDILAELIASAELNIDPTFCRVDLLLITVVDQWRFLVESADTPTVINVSEWIVRFMEAIRVENGHVQQGAVGDETSELLSQLRDQLKSRTQDTTCRAIFETALEERDELGEMKELVATNTIRETEHMSRLPDPPPKAHPKREIGLPAGPSEEHEDHPGLHQWSRHEVQDAISEGHIKALILCLCSKFVGIRKQALVEVRAFMMKLKASDYSEWQQTYMLVGETIETAANIVADNPLPYHAGVLAADLCSVLSDPLHFMYVKVNEFLNRGPEWNVTKLPSYWVDKVLMKPPTEDDGYYQEAEWLLNGLVDGLRHEYLP